ncbi:uncharacterized protein TRAVEDRAFT_24113 [Trametes versicolor FP-101664 SS1]|uniref:uncharacterized protein n=1 Tax=Trametes versicolor (strain FP-101664) TaxID=717944 RepID=UPI0004621E62|nr:uncharacterized protein TRAVEDRAFT_24113 [Trametes versicolor FP-101664 SS1]EIW52646.1 hypothetical protein TRAVEDRAFT_24113 [Trametes versicolor FP-101664 SS1]
MSNNTTPLDPGAGPYLLQNARSGTMLDMSLINPGTIHGWDRHGRANQQWDFIANGGQGYAIRCVYRSQPDGLPMFLTVAEGVLSGTDIIASPYPVNWNVEQTADNSLRISWPNSQLVITLGNGGSAANGTKIQLAPLEADDPAQLWNYSAVQPAQK